MTPSHLSCVASSSRTGEREGGREEGRASGLDSGLLVLPAAVPPSLPPSLPPYLASPQERGLFDTRFCPLSCGGACTPSFPSPCLSAPADERACVYTRERERERERVQRVGRSAGINALLPSLPPPLPPSLCTCFLFPCIFARDAEMVSVLRNEGEIS